MDPTASVAEAMVQADILHGEVGAAGTPTHQLGDALHWLAWLACEKVSSRQLAPFWQEKSRDEPHHVSDEPNAPVAD
jgi:hypothetical protein